MPENTREPRKTTPWVVIRSCFRWALAGFFLTFFSALVFVVTLVVSHLKIDPLILWMTRSLVFASGAKLRVHGLEKIDPQKAYLIVFNHLNLMDHIFIHTMLGLRFRGVEKEAHFKWPIYGSLLRRIGIIPIPPRGNTRGALASLEKLKAYLAQGISIVVVPEGTRSPDGKLGPFKKGAFYLAVQTQATILPVTQVGAYEFLRKGDWRVYPKPIDLYVEDPISAEGLDVKDVKELTDRVRNVIASRLERATPPG